MNFLRLLGFALAAAWFGVLPARAEPKTDGPAEARDKAAFAEAQRGWWKESMKTHDERIAWWREARFGMYIHWGAYSGMGGEWHGATVPGYAEQILRLAKIPVEEYRKEVIETFNPVDFDADAWMRTAKDAGMRYMIITAKHHDGFAMFPSNAYPYDIRLTKFHRDPMKELRDAATKFGIRFGFYYSQANDWQHPDASGMEWTEPTRPDSVSLIMGKHGDWNKFPAMLNRVRKYVDGKAIPQIEELITRYHPDILWFDTAQHLPRYENLRILEAVRKIGPDIVVNGRLVSNGPINFGDYASTGDRAAFFRPSYPGDWEAIPTTNESYAYKINDHSHKPPEHFVRLLAGAVARGGNLLLDIGPMGDGKIDPRDLAILGPIGKWMDVNHASIYGNHPTPLARQTWGETTMKDGVLYLHVFKWPKKIGQLVVGGLQTRVKKAYLLADPKQAPLTTKPLGDRDLGIEIPATAPDPMDSVIALEIDGPIKADPVPLLVAKGVANDLMAFDATRGGVGLAFGDGKKFQEFIWNWTRPDQTVSWKFRLDEPAEFDVTLQYVTKGSDDRGQIFVDVDGRKFPVDYEPHVSEEDQASAKVGRVKLDAGEHEITLRAGKYQGKQLLEPLYLTLTPAGV